MSQPNQQPPPYPGTANPGYNPYAPQQPAGELYHITVLSPSLYVKHVVGFQATNRPIPLSSRTRSSPTSNRRVRVRVLQIPKCLFRLPAEYRFILLSSIMFPHFLHLIFSGVLRSNPVTSSR